MANALTVDKVVTGDREKRIRYRVVLSGNYVQAVRGNNAGEVLDLNAATGSNQGDQFWGAKGPEKVYPIQGPAGYTVEILPGADGRHWLYKIYSAVGTELVAGAYPAAITGDNLGDVMIEAVGREFD